MLYGSPSFSSDISETVNASVTRLVKGKVIHDVSWIMECRMLIRPVLIKGFLGARNLECSYTLSGQHTIYLPIVFILMCH